MRDLSKAWLVVRLRRSDKETNLCDGQHTSRESIQKLRNPFHPFWIIDTALEIEKQLPALVVATGSKLILVIRRARSI